jgi:hypothetical protein
LFCKKNIHSPTYRVLQSIIQRQKKETTFKVASFIRFISKPASLFLDEFTYSLMGAERTLGVKLGTP